MITVYHAPNTRSMRIVWLLEELGLPYETKKMEFSPRDLQSEEYLALHPLGQVPTIEDGDLVMNESGAITEWILAKYGNGRLMPAPGTNEHAKFLYWLHFAEASFMPPLGAIAQHAFIRPEADRIPQVLKESQARALQIAILVDKALEGKDFILGSEFSAADTMLGYSVHLCKMFQLLGDTVPNLTAYYERVSARAGFQKAAAP